MMATIPSRCDCGGRIYSVSCSYWEPPEEWGCGDCCRNDEQIAAEHDTTTCATPECEWCAFIEEATR